MAPWRRLFAPLLRTSMMKLSLDPLNHRACDDAVQHKGARIPRLVVPEAIRRSATVADNSDLGKRS